MKERNEIQKMIDELMKKASDAKSAGNEVRHEALCNQIDALLWVIGDESGKPIG